jgi:stage II sporulation protein D
VAFAVVLVAVGCLAAAALRASARAAPVAGDANIAVADATAVTGLREVASVTNEAEVAATVEPLTQAPGAGLSTDEIARGIAGSAFVIVDVDSGRTIREQRAEWLDTPVWPGSIAKIATFAAALDAHTLTDRTRIVCTRQLTLANGRKVDCSHPPLGRPLSVVDALAYSCNVFAATVARGLTAAQLSRGFVQMGLPPVPAGGDPIAAAIGLDGAKVPPRRLIEPLLRVWRESNNAHDASDAAANVRPLLLLRDGLRESARNGTASAFARAGIDAFAKTGTAPMRNGRALGLVSAIAPRYGIVLALPGGTGAQAAEVAAAILKPLLAEHADASGSPASTPRGKGTRRPATAGARDDAASIRSGSRASKPVLLYADQHAANPVSTAVSVLPSSSSSSSNDRGASSRQGETVAPVGSVRAASVRADSIRVGRANATGYAVETMALEDYVAQVVAGETSDATPAAAREALAITARTYAAVNRGRHAADGFDLCSLTHCQVLRPATVGSRAAADRTSGRVLVRDGKPAPVFYSASCGGTLVDSRALLPGVDPKTMPWLAARADPAGIEEPAWQSEIPAAALLRALQASGSRGDTLRNFSARVDASGLITQLAFDGLLPSTMTADQFRRAVGQQLGWQHLKSGRFRIERTAAGYRFIGRGHGHGVGLCVLGASAFAARRANATWILHAYFPGLRIATSQALSQGRGGDAPATESAAAATPGSAPAPRGTSAGSVPASRDAGAGSLTATDGATAAGTVRTTSESRSRADADAGQAIAPERAEYAPRATSQPSALRESEPQPAAEASTAPAAIDRRPSPRAASGPAALPEPEPQAAGAGQASIAPTLIAPTSIDLRLPSADERERPRLMRLLDRNLRDLGERLSLPSLPALSVVVHPTGDSYRRAAGRPWWTSGATVIEGDRITLHLAPLSAIDHSGRLEQTVRHETVHALTFRALADRPRWVHEGLALHFAGERVTIEPGAETAALTCPSDRELMRARDHDAFDRAYTRAVACVERELSQGRAWRDLGKTTPKR